MYQIIKDKFYRWLAISRLVRRYEYLLQVDKILEEYITDRILKGGSTDMINQGRGDLLKKQAEIREQEKMLVFLKSL